MTHKTLSAVAGAVVLALGATSAVAAAGHGGPQGPHDYQLNIIGVEKGKKARMTNNDRRTIFVPLKSTKTGEYSKPNFNQDGVGVQTAIVDSKIWLVPGDSFSVCAGTGIDLAYGCNDSYLGNWSTMGYNEFGEEVAIIDQTRNGAVFQLPCNTNLNGEYWDSDGDGRIESNGDDAALDNLVSCNEAVDSDGNTVPYTGDTVPTANYEIWARSLGKPGGSAVVTTCATVDGELQCSLENVVMTRSTGKSTFADVTNQMSSLVIGYCLDSIYDAGDYLTCDDGDSMDGDVTDGDVDWTRIALFAGNTQDWFWNYDNNGLRLAQLRFYYVD